MANEKVQNNRRPMGGPGRGPGGRFMMPLMSPSLLSCELYMS